MMTGLVWMKTSRQGDTNAGVGAHSARQLVGYNWYQAASGHSPMLLTTWGSGDTKGTMRKHKDFP